MRWSSFLATAAILTVVSVASADDPGRFRPARLSNEAVSNPFETPVADYYAGATRASSFTDYPAYPIGFTSYRGLGFWGTCCEKNPPKTEHVWDGYCAQKGCGACQKSGFGGPNLFGTCCPAHRGKLQSHFAAKPDWCCYPQCCSSCCGGVGANWWPVTPTCRQRCHEPVCCKLQRLHNRCCGLFNKCFADEGCTDCPSKYAPPQDAGSQDAPSPTPAESQPTEQDNPTSADAQPQLPAPETSTDFSNELPPLTTEDKSASRIDLRRLPAISITY